MLVEFLIAGILVSLGLIGFGWYSRVLKDDNKGNLFLVAGALMMIVVAMMVAGDSTGIEVQTYGGCIDNTTETSHVWNCTTTDEYCFGVPDKGGCWAYDISQCNAIDGCTWEGTQLFCWGTPEPNCTELYDDFGAEKCRETWGCYLANESNPQTCDSYTTTYEYGECYHHSVGFNYTQIITVMLILAGIGTLLGVIGWSKYGNIYKNV